MLPSSSLAETAASFELTASRLALLEAVRTLSSSSTELELVLLMIADARFLFLPSLLGEGGGREGWKHPEDESTDVGAGTIYSI